MSKRVLIIDDDEDMQDLLREALEIEDYEVMVAEDGIVALDTIKDSPPDLILLDLMMPRMDGSTFAHELREQNLASTVPIIVVSADVNAKQKVEQMGADSYITKPFDLHHLLDEVSHFTDPLTPPHEPPRATAS